MYIDFQQLIIISIFCKLQVVIIGITVYICKRKKIHKIVKKFIE